MKEFGTGSFEQQLRDELKFKMGLELRSIVGVRVGSPGMFFWDAVVGDERIPWEQGRRGIRKVSVVMPLEMKPDDFRSVFARAIVVGRIAEEMWK